LRIDISKRISHQVSEQFCAGKLQCELFDTSFVGCTSLIAGLFFFDSSSGISCLISSCLSFLDVFLFLHDELTLRI